MADVVVSVLMWLPELLKIVYEHLIIEKIMIGIM